jgi:hypothetical protein
MNPYRTPDPEALRRERLAFALCVVREIGPWLIVTSAALVALVALVFAAPERFRGCPDAPSSSAEVSR